jgi:hypothetical protein
MYTLSHSVSDVGWGFTDGTYGYMAGDLRILSEPRDLETWNKPKTRTDSF